MLPTLGFFSPHASEKLRSVLAALEAMSGPAALALTWIMRTEACCCSADQMGPSSVAAPIRHSRLSFGYRWIEGR